MSGRSLLLDPRAGWRDEPALSASVVVDDVVRLAADTDAPLPLADPHGTFGGLADPTGAAADGAGRHYSVDPAGCRVLRLDECAEPGTPRWRPLPCYGGCGSGARELRNPRGLAVTRAGDLVVADTGNRRLVLLAPDAVAVRRIVGAPAAHPAWTPVDVAVDGSGRLLVADRSGGLVHVLTCDGVQLAAWDGAVGKAGPLTAPTAIAVDRDGRVYVVDEGSPAVRVLDRDGTVVEVRETTAGLADRFCPPALGIAPDGSLVPAAELPPRVPRYAPTGTAVTVALDSRRHRCTWHRVRLDARIAVGTSVAVRTLTADVPLAAAEVAALPADRWRGGQVHGVVGSAPWDCLVLSPPGRYLWLQLVLTGSGLDTPFVHSVTVEFPRTTSARFLPAAFREDPVAADFTERFVALLDAVRATVTTRIDGFAALLDPHAAPDGSGGEPDFLGWLASWLGLAADLRLPAYRRRRLVAEAHRLYRLRGTPEGLRAHLEVCLGVEAHVMEEYALRRWLYVGSGRLGDTAAVWGDDVVRRLQLDATGRLDHSMLVGSTDPLRDPFHVHAHRFRVYLPGGADDERRRLAERVVELAKPAHTEARVVFAAPRMRVGVQAFVGVDSVVGAYPSGVATGSGRLGSDTVLAGGTAASRPGLRVGRTTRVETSTVLN